MHNINLLNGNILKKYDLISLLIVSIIIVGTISSLLYVEKSIILVLSATVLSFFLKYLYPILGNSFHKESNLKLEGSNRMSSDKIDLEKWDNEIIDSIKVPLFLCDEHGIILRLNKSAANFFGLIDDKMCGWNSSKLFSRDGSSENESPIMQCANLRKSVSQKILLNNCECIVSSDPVFVGKNIIYVVTTIQDISQMSKMLNSAIALRNCMKYFLTEKSADNALLGVLRVICSYLQADRCYVLNFDLLNSTMVPTHEFKRYPSAPSILALGKKFIDKNSIRYLCLMKRELFTSNDTSNYDGSADNNPWIEEVRRLGIKSLFGMPIYIDEQLWGYLGVTYEKSFRNLSIEERDFLVSSARITEICLEKKRAADAMEKALEKARIAEKAKSFFLASVSHEIRTPLNSLLGFAEMLRDSNSLNESERKEYVNAISVSGNALLKLINDVLDLSRLEAGKFEFNESWTDINELCSDICGIFRSTCKQKKLEFHECIEDIPFLFLDVVRIRQTIFNLLGNAVKYTDQGSISLLVKFLPNADGTGTLKFSVSDTGRGISEEDKVRIFEPYVQLNDMRGRNATSTGSGLGLAITFRMAKEMGGNIAIKSKIGQGSTFSFILGKIQIKEKSKSTIKKSIGENCIIPIDSGKSSFNKINVLIVDDVRTNLFILGAQIMKLGANVEKVESAREAIQRLENGKFDCVMTDLWMPDVNGSELAKKIRSNIHLSYLKIAAVTADTLNSRDFDMTLFDTIITKPVTISAVKSFLLSVMTK